MRRLPGATGPVLIGVLVFLVLCVAVPWAVATLFLKGEDLSAFDRPEGERFGTGRPPSAELTVVVASLADMRTRLDAVPLRERIPALRRTIDELFADRAFDATFSPVLAAGVPGEWVLGPGADPERRTLYIHGGGFMIGSPRSHRTLTTRFSAITGGAVLAIDYRLMPEHPRMAGVEDCRAAYRWLLENGPGGPTPARCVVVAGESAGGNLALALIAWLRDQGLRLPDAAVALSPATDGTLGSPSLRANLRTDPMLGPLFAPAMRLPRWMLLWAALFVNRRLPRDPEVSPVHGDLSGLPPILVHASEVEMLLDDGRRYANRAAGAGSPVRLQTWGAVVHAWHFFNPDLPEAREALAEVEKFLTATLPARAAADR